MLLLELPLGSPSSSRLAPTQTKTNSKDCKMRTRPRPLSKMKRKTKGSQSESSGKAREALIQAAKTLFARKGLASTTIRDIAKSAKLNSSLISYYFGGKEELYKACILAIGDSQYTAARDLLRDPKSPEEFRLRLGLFIENMFNLFIQDRDAGLIIVRELDRSHSPAETEFRMGFLRVFDLIIQYFKSAQKQKMLAKDKDPFILASLLFGALSHVMRLDHLKEDAFQRSIKNKSERDKVQKHLLDLFCA